MREHTIGAVHDIICNVHDIIGNVHDIIGNVHDIIGNVSLTNAKPMIVIDQSIHIWTYESREGGREGEREGRRGREERRGREGEEGRQNGEGIRGDDVTANKQYTELPAASVLPVSW